MRASIPYVKDPAGLSRSDEKCPNGPSLMHWQGCRASLETLAATYLACASTTAGSVAEGAALQKNNKYSAFVIVSRFRPTETLCQKKNQGTG